MKKNQILIDARNEKELYQRQVAEEAGISRTYYLFLENGRYQPSVELAKKLGEILEIEWYKILE